MPLKTKTELPALLTARVIFSLHQWLVVVIIARTGGTEALGLFGLALAIITPVNGLFGLGLRQGIATDVAGAFPSGSYWYLRLSGLVLSLLVTSTICFGFSADLMGLAPVLAAVFVMKAADLCSELCYGFRQREDRLTAIAVSQTLRAALGVVVFAGVWLTGGGLVAAICAWAGTWAVIFIALDLRSGGASNPLPTRPAPWRYVVSLGLVQLPFGIAAGVVLTGLSTPRLVLASTVSLETLGIFSALFMVFQAGSTLVNTVVQAWLNPLANAFHTKDTTTAKTVIRSIFLAVSGFGLLLFLLVLAAGSWLLKILYGPEYMAYSSAFTLLALAWAMRFPSLVLRSIFHAQRRFWAGLSHDCLATGLTLAACLIASAINPAMEAVCAGLAVAWAIHLAVLLVMSRRALGRIGKSAPGPTSHADI